MHGLDGVHGNIQEYFQDLVPHTIDITPSQSCQWVPENMGIVQVGCEQGMDFFDDVEQFVRMFLQVGARAVEFTQLTHQVGQSGGL